jgi:hypothetical protein
MSDLADDLLWGAGAIAKELFGRDTKSNRRRIYHMHQQHRLPTWKQGEGAEIITKRSLLREHFNPPEKVQAAE